jgi:hypothetical protein
MTEFGKIKDTGKREDMSTGSRRDTNEGKPRPDLINPLVLRRLGYHFGGGCEKYGERNFELGQPTGRYWESHDRHVLDKKEGLKDEDHLSAAIWNLMGIMLNEEMVKRGIYPPEIDNATDYTCKEGFDNTVGKWAREHNDMLRQQEKMAKPTTPLLISAPKEYEGFEEVPELPVCFGVCHTDECPCHDEDECLMTACHECEFETECDDMATNVYNPDEDDDGADEELIIQPIQCKGCLSYYKDYSAYPCNKCFRNVDNRGNHHDYYISSDDVCC